MNTTEKGNKLEDKFFDYLLDQVRRDGLVFDVYPADLCTIHKKKKYYCRERKGDVEFDVVIEVRRKERVEPHIFVIFECKNHQDPIQERDITDFSDKVGRIFGHAVKGLVVTTSRLQSGAESIARSRRLGIVKFDEDGIDIVVDRKGGSWTEDRFLQTQLFETSIRSKSLKFSAYYEDRFFASVRQLLDGFRTDRKDDFEALAGRDIASVPFVPNAEINKAAQESLTLIQYSSGAVDLEKLCAKLAVELTFSDRTIHDSDGNPILGSANFDKRWIEINEHGNKHRERFTIDHEIGHFCLGHDLFLRSDSIIEQDLFVDAGTGRALNFERLEHQANLFASELLLPDQLFRELVLSLRQQLGIYDKGFGYIFVDDQPCNYTPYNHLLSNLSDYFDASRQAIDIRLKGMGLVTDKRRDSQQA